MLHLPLSIYIHLPWCVKKCPYCDFNSHEFTYSGLQQEKYVAALLRDIDFTAEQFKYSPITSIFFGGGTPSLFSAESIHTILSHLKARFEFVSDIEITLEANPGTVDIEYFNGYKQAGVNRLSIGIQSFHDDSLKALGRIHDAKAAVIAVQTAQDCGLDNINLDLMYGLPAQSVELALQDLDKAIQLQPQHISWYQLTIEPNTLFYSVPPTLPEDDVVWQIFAHGSAMLNEHDFQQYEVSAYSQSGYQCRHNSNYWQFGDYLGFGAGAHGKLTSPDSAKITRSVRHKIPDSYMSKAGSQAVITQQHEVLAADRIFEFMLNALRLKHGVSAHLFEQRTGLKLDACHELMQTAVTAGLLLFDNKTIKASDRGYRYLNDLTACFIPKTA